MKKFLLILLSITIVITGIFILLNMNVTTRQGINYQVNTIRIPLYLKILDFFDRHYNYKELVKKITSNRETEKERIMKIFEWTYQNIRKVPDDFPVIDDHVWHIIIRGYGASDQSSDVFTTLCNYAGIDAFFSFLYSKDRSSKIPFSFVRLDKEWRVFDPYNGVYFINNHGGIASIEEINAGDWQIQSLVPAVKDYLNYKLYLRNVPVITGTGGLNRANTQSPLRRFILEVKKWIEVK